MRAVLLLTAFVLAGPAGASAPTAILSSDSSHYRQALEGFNEAWGSTVTVLAVGAPLPEGARAFVAFGSKAAARAWPKDALVVSCLAPSVAADDGGAVTRVSLLPAPEALLARARGLIPALKVFRVFWSSDSSRADAQALVRAGAEAGMTVELERIDPPSRLPERLRALTGRPDALWLMPDPALVTEDNFTTLREYAAAEKIPFLAPTEGLAKRGASATIAVSFRDMGRAAAGALRERLEGRAEPEVVRLERVRVTVNAAAARAAGMGPTFESADEVLP